MKKLYISIAVLLCMTMLFAGCSAFGAGSSPAGSISPSADVSPAASPSANTSASASADASLSPLASTSASASAYVSASPSVSASASPSADVSASPSASVAANTPVEGKIGEYSVKITKMEAVKDYKKKDSVRVYFEFTNNSQNATSFILATLPKAYQDDKLLKAATLLNESNTDKAYDTVIQPGATVACSKAFLVVSKSPVNIKVTPFFSGHENNTLTATFTIG